MHHIDGTPWGTRGGISRRAHVPGRRRVHVPRHAARHAGRRAVRQRREPQRAAGDFDQRRARRAARHRLPDEREGQERAEPDRRRGFTSRPDRSGLRPRSSRSSTASSTTWSRRSTTRWPTPSTATTSASPSCRTCATSASPGRYTVTGVSDTPSRRKVFVCRPMSPADEIPCARKIVSQLASQAYRRPPTQRGRRVADAVLRRRPQGQGLRGRASSRCCRRCWRARISCSGSKRCRLGRPAGPELPRSPMSTSRRGSRTSSGARCPDAELQKVAAQRHAAHAGGAREAGPPDARRSARRSDVDAVRVAVAAAAGRREDSPRRAAVSVVRQRAGRVLQARNRAALRQHRPRGSQRPRPVHRRLHVRQRAHRQGLRHPEHHRRATSGACRSPTRTGAASSATAAS